MLTRGIPDVRRAKGMHVLTFKEGEMYVLNICPDRQQWVQAFLHYCTENERRVLCGGPDHCRCKGKGTGWAIEERVYVPAQYIRPIKCGETAMQPSSSIVPAEGILGVTEKILEILYEHDGKGTWVVQRRGKKKNGPMDAHSCLWALDSAQWKTTYPVWETIVRLYGMRT